MGSKENAAAVRESIDAFNARRQPAHVLAGARLELVPFGTSLDYGSYTDMWIKGFPDGRIDLKSIVADDRYAVVEFEGSGTHEGPFDLGGRRLEATHRPGNLRFVQVLEMKDGKIAGGRVYFDLATLLSNLGLAEGIAGARRPEAGEPARH